MEENALLVLCLVLTFVISVITSGIVATIIAKKKAYKNINKVFKKAKEVKNIKELTQMTTTILSENEKQHEQLKKDINNLIIEKVNNIKNIATIRYDSTPDSGGKMSFSIALLNETFNGIILTNIYMREGSFLYLREIQEGKSEVELSEEEKKVLNKAIINYK